MSGPPSWPASLWQRFALRIEQARPGMALGPWFTMNAVVRVRGPLRPSVLAAAVDELVRRHDILRTRLALDGAAPRQVVAPRVTGLLEVCDAAAEPAPQGWLHAPVRVEGPTPLRVRLVRQAGDAHLLALHLHHLMADPVTLWAVLAELAALYRAALGGAPPPAPGAPYGEYASAEAEQLRTGRTAATQWWRRQVGGGTRFALLTGAERGAPFAYRDTLLPAAEAATVGVLSRRHRSTPFVTLLAATACAMAAQLDDGDVLMLNTLFGRRDRPQWQRTLGPCLVPAYLPLPRPPARLDAGYLHRTRDAVLACQRHARFPVEQVDAMHPWLTDPAAVVPFFEYLPGSWPAPVAFGPATGTVVAAAGPRDTGRAGALGIRVRVSADGSLAGHLSGDGVGWTRARTAALLGELPRQLRHATGPGPATG